MNDGPEQVKSKEGRVCIYSFRVGDGDFCLKLADVEIGQKIRVSSFNLELCIEVAVLGP